MTPLFRLNIQKACDVEWLEIWPSKIPPNSGREVDEQGQQNPWLTWTVKSWLVHNRIVILVYYNPNKSGQEHHVYKGNVTRAFEHCSDDL